MSTSTAWTTDATDGRGDYSENGGGLGWPREAGHRPAVRLAVLVSAAERQPYNERATAMVALTGDTLDELNDRANCC